MPASVVGQTGWHRDLGPVNAAAGAAEGGGAAAAVVEKTYPAACSSQHKSHRSAGAG